MGPYTPTNSNKTLVQFPPRVTLKSLFKGFLFSSKNGPHRNYGFLCMCVFGSLSSCELCLFGPCVCLSECVFVCVRVSASVFTFNRMVSSSESCGGYC